MPVDNSYSSSEETKAEISAGVWKPTKGYFLRRDGQIVYAAQFTGNNVSDFEGAWKNPYSPPFVDSGTLVVEVERCHFVNLEIGEWAVPSMLTSLYRKYTNEYFMEEFQFVSLEDPNPKHEDHKHIENWADQSVQLLDAVKKLKLPVNLSKTPTHNISLSVMVGSPDEWKAVFGLFTDIMNELGGDRLGVSLHSFAVEEENETKEGDPYKEYDSKKFGEEAFHKIRAGLIDAGVSIGIVEQVMNREILNGS